MPKPQEEKGQKRNWHRSKGRLTASRRRRAKFPHWWLPKCECQTCSNLRKARAPKRPDKGYR